jgi:hypothetical protein
VPGLFHCGRLQFLGRSWPNTAVRIARIAMAGIALTRHRVMKPLVYGIAATLLLFICVIFAGSVAYIAWSEVLPAIRTGGPCIETSSRIFNVSREGNEI